MSLLFTPCALGPLEIKNRFVHSATYECMAGSDGSVTDELLKRYTRIARGGTGLIIPGHLFVTFNGRGMNLQTGIHSDDMVGGLAGLVDAVHREDGKIAFQLVHAGRQTTKDVIGETPLAPSRGPRDPVYMVKPRGMRAGDIQAVIRAYAAAARRARQAGADGVQIHAAHGYLVNQFLSPFFNKRTDAWGGSDENRFRFLKEIILQTKASVGDQMAVLVKLNTRDYTPQEGITLDLAQKYAAWLTDLPVDGLEVSCGTGSYSLFNMARGDVPTQEMVLNLPWWMKILGRRMLKKMEGRFDLVEGYNLAAARRIKPVIGGMPLLLVGGLRRRAHMEEVIGKGFADLISLSRPFIREPGIVNKIRDGKTTAAACVSCNRCIAAIANDLPLRCFHKGFPQKPAR